MDLSEAFRIFAAGTVAGLAISVVLSGLLFFYLAIISWRGSRNDRD